jgi:hypothetical protein
MVCTAVVQEQPNSWCPPPGLGQSSEESQHLGLSSMPNNNYPSKPHLTIKIPSYSSETKLPLWPPSGAVQPRTLTEIQPTSSSQTPPSEISEDAQSKTSEYEDALSSPPWFM